MQSAYKIGFIGALIYISFEMLLVIKGWNHLNYAHVIAFGFNSLCLLVIITYSILSGFKRIKHTSPSLIIDIKSGLKTTAVYAITVALFIFVYYRWIDPEYPKLKRQQLLELTMDKKAMEEIAKNHIQENPDFFDGKSDEDLIDMQQQNIIEIMEPSKAFPITLFSLMLLGMIFSFLITALNRALLSKI